MSQQRYNTDGSRQGREGNRKMQQMTMEGLRQGALARFTAAATTTLFTFVFYLAPTGSAVAQMDTQREQREAAAEAIQESTPNKKLAHRLEKPLGWQHSQ